MDKEIEEMIQNRIEDIYQSGEYIYQAKELEEILSYIEQLKNDYKEANDSVTWWTNRYNAVIRNNQQLKKQQEDGVEYIKENVYIDYYGVSVFREKDGVDKLLRMLGEKDGNT